MIGSRVFVDDGRSCFEGLLLNDETTDLAEVLDDDSGEVVRGSWDFVEILD